MTNDNKSGSLSPHNATDWTELLPKKTGVFGSGRKTLKFSVEWTQWVSNIWGSLIYRFCLLQNSSNFTRNKNNNIITIRPPHPSNLKSFAFTFNWLCFSLFLGTSTSKSLSLHQNILGFKWIAMSCQCWNNDIDWTGEWTPQIKEKRHKANKMRSFKLSKHTDIK